MSIGKTTIIHYSLRLEFYLNNSTKARLIMIMKSQITIHNSKIYDYSYFKYSLFDMNFYDIIRKFI